MGIPFACGYNNTSGLGVERAVFENPNVLGQHMRPLYIMGHLDGTLVN
jgi:hypothetical protein